MNVSYRWIGAVMALGFLTGAAFAEVTVSSATNPTASLGTEFASLMKTEHATVVALATDELSEIARGPKAAANTMASAKANGAAPAGLQVEYTYAWLMAQSALADNVDKSKSNTIS